MSPAEVSAMLGVVIITWMIKLLFGFIPDGVTILGYGRRLYIIFSGILGAFSWVVLVKWVRDQTLKSLAISSKYCQDRKQKKIRKGNDQKL